MTFALIGALLAALPLSFFLMDGGEDPPSPVLLYGLAAFFGVAAIHAITRKMRFFDGYISTSLLGVWISRRIPPGVRFEELVNDAGSHSGAAKWMFRIPNDIVARSSGGRRIRMRISGDLLGSLGREEYRKLLGQLGKRYGDGAGRAS